MDLGEMSLANNPVVTKTDICNVKPFLQPHKMTDGLFIDRSYENAVQGV